MSSPPPRPTKCMLTEQHRCHLFWFATEPRYGKEILGKRLKILASDGKRWRNATVSGYHGGYLRHTGKCWRSCDRGWLLDSPCASTLVAVHSLVWLLWLLRLLRPHQNNAGLMHRLSVATPASSQ